MKVFTGLIADATNQLTSETKTQTRPYRNYWRGAQLITWFIGLGIWLTLFLKPTLGIHLFWNVLIPVAPLLFVLAVGIWRNVCPMATTTLLPRHLGLSQKISLTKSQLSKLNIAGIALLYLLVALRHSFFNTNGPATGMLIGVLMLAGLLLNLFFDWKSAWCSGLCPILPVEKLYGSNVATSPMNAHCSACSKCVKPCPDTSPNYHPTVSSKYNLQNLANVWIIGGLPGFIWGWFQVADRVTAPGFIHVMLDIALPFSGLVISMVIYLLLAPLFTGIKRKQLNKVFAAAAVSCYYWFRIPALIGFGDFPADGRLVDLTGALPYWSVLVIELCFTAFFIYWLVLKKQSKKSWISRPEFA